MEELVLGLTVITTGNIYHFHSPECQIPHKTERKYSSEKNSLIKDF